MPPAARAVCASLIGRLPDRENRDPGLGELDGGTQPRPAGADDEDGRGELVFAWWHSCDSSRQTSACPFRPDSDEICDRTDKVHPGSAPVGRAPSTVQEHDERHAAAESGRSARRANGVGSSPLSSAWRGVHRVRHSRARPVSESRCSWSTSLRRPRASWWPARRASRPTWSWPGPASTSCARRCSARLTRYPSRSGTPSESRSGWRPATRPTGSSWGWRC